MLLNSLARIERLRTAETAEAHTQRRALEIYAARRFSPLAARPEFDGRLRPFRASAIDIARRHSTVSDADFLSAIRELGDETLDRLNRLDLTLEAVPVLLEWMAVLAYLVLLSLVSAFAFRGGLTFLLFRIALVDDEGAPSFADAALFRAACSWSPVLAFQIALPSAKVVLMTYPVGRLDVGCSDCRHDARRCVLVDPPTRARPAGSHRSYMGRAEMSWEMSFDTTAPTTRPRDAVY